MLEFSGRIGFGVDVRDFLELQRAFHRNWKVHAATKEQGMMLRLEAARPGAHLRLDRKHRLHRPRQVAQLRDQLALALRGQAAPLLGQHQREHE
ncbi:hypothetical protein D3C83_13960 [compost metagenome]